MGRAWVAVDLEVLAKLLGLPRGTEIIRADLNEQNFRLRLGLESPALPKTEPSMLIPDITLQFRTEDVNGKRRTYGAFSSSPEKEWLISESHVPDEAGRVA